MRVLGAALTDEELAARLTSSQATIADLRAKLEQLQSTVTRPIAPGAREELNKRIAKYKVRCHRSGVSVRARCGSWIALTRASCRKCGKTVGGRPWTSSA